MAYDMRSVKELEGEVVTAIIAFLDPKRLIKIHILKVEDYGIWAEIPAFDETILAKVGATFSPKSAGWFVPWNQVVCVLISLDIPSVSERLLTE